MKRQQKQYRWYYRFPGHFYAMGPTTKTFPNTMRGRRALSKHLRKVWELERLPRNTEVWRA